jgi:hypothetical protein
MKRRNSGSIIGVVFLANFLLPGSGTGINNKLQSRFPSLDPNGKLWRSEV